MTTQLKPRAVSCGCCTGGCCCHFHQDTPRGRPPRVCEYHKEHGHPRVTEEPEARASSRKPNISRTGERLIRLAYDLEAIANRLGEAGKGDEGRGVREAARICGAVGRGLDGRPS